LLALAACTDGATPVCSGDAGCGTDTFDATVFEAGFEAGSEAGADARDAGTKPEAASADTGMDTATPADAGAPADTGAEASSGDATSDAPPADAPAAQG
jgi:hypothetical protein